MEGFFIYVQEDIQNLELKIHITLEDIKGIFIEINLIKTKWPFCCFFSLKTLEKR